MSKREAVGRYRGSMLGTFWSLATPLAMLAIYTFVFSEVFAVRWPGADGHSKIEFALILFTGLSVFGVFSECVTKAPGLIAANANFVKKLVFPIEILPIVSLLAATYHLALAILVLFALLAFLETGIPATAALIFVVLIPILLVTLGVSWFLAALGVFFRDVGQTIGPLVTGLMFLSPIFFPSTALPVEWIWLINLNPLAPSIEAARSVLIFGRAPDWPTLVGSFGIGALVAWLGFAWFQLARKGFADVL